ncbi:nesprin-1-like [Montipora foliosa]|uniref:nesprin-1-like n=1 Tax=Montipora foliosa TaxID=591990 RepID=UPI0035F1335F
MAELKANDRSEMESAERLDQLQELFEDLEESHSRLESLRSDLDGKREVLPQKEFQELKDQVTPLEKRFTEFRGGLTKAIDDNKRTIKRQKEFDQGHVKIRSVLETVLGATDKTTFDETDTAVDLERVEDFQRNFERYRHDFDSLLRQSEDLDQDNNTNSRYKSRLDENISHVRQLWSSVLRRADDYKDQVGKQVDRLKEFQRRIEELMDWMNKIEAHSGFTVPSCTNIQQMKVHFEHVKMCQKEINSQRPRYNALSSTGQQIIRECRGSLGNQATSELDKVTRRWMMITNLVTTNQQQLELSLKDWQEYTSLTENLMVWLREKEKILRPQSKATSVHELERELNAMKAIAGEVDIRRPQLEKIRKRAEELYKSTDQYDSERIRKQVSSMMSLWENVCHLLSNSLQSCGEILRQFEQFSLLQEKLSRWLANIESSVSHDLEESFLSIPDDQGDTVFQVYVADIERHEAIRSTMNECAYYVVSKAGGTPYAGAVAEQQKHLNDRWRTLCQQLGITYKKAEETRYGLKLLEIQLKQLNTWIAELERRLVDFNVARLCGVADIQRKVKEIKGTEVDVERRAGDVETVLRLCEKLRHDRMACQSEADRQILQRSRESFENRWSNVCRTVSTKRRQAEERLLLCKEFWNEYNEFIEWLNETEDSTRKSEDAAKLGLETSKIRLKRFEMLLKDITDHKPQLERILKRSKYIIFEVNTSSASDIKLGVKSVEARWQGMFSQIESLVNRQSRLTSQALAFEQLHKEVNSFLTEAELKLIELDPYTSEDEPRVQLEKLKNLQRLINSNYSKLKSLLQEGKSIREHCSPYEFQPLQQTMDDLNSRWQQSLHCCMTWILDLAIPSPRSSSTSPSSAAGSSSTKK